MNPHVYVEHRPPTGANRLSAGTEPRAPLFRRAEQREGRVPVWVKLCQGVGALPGQHKDWAFNTLLLLYYSQVLGLPASYAGAVLSIALILDAVSDPLVGAYSDNFKAKYGRRHPFMLAAVIPVAASAFALFAPPDGLSTTGLTIWMLIATVTLRLTFTLFVVPWNAVAAELSQDYRERTSIITYRMAIGWIGGVIFIFAMYSLVFPTSEAYSNSLLDASRYPLFAMIFSLLVLIWMLIPIFGTLGQIRFLPQPTAAAPRQSLHDMWTRTVLALKSRNFRRIFLATLISSAVLGTGQVFDVYMNLFFWEFSTEDIRWLSFVVIGAIASFVTAGLWQRRFEKSQIMGWSLLAFTALAMSKVLLRFANVWPENGDPSLIWWFVGHGCLAAYTGSMVLIMFASMVADTVDEQDYEHGLRQEGIFSAGIAFAGKAVTSLGLMIGGFLLDFVIRMPRDGVPGGVPDDTLFRLAVTDGIAIPAFNLLAFWLLTRYSLDRHRLSEIQAVLKERSAAGEEPIQQ